LLLLGLLVLLVQRAVSVADRWYVASRFWGRFVRALVGGRLWRVEVDGHSMAPTLVAGQILWCEARPASASLEIGDIVVFGGDQLRNPPDLHRLDGVSGETELELGVKRLSALPNAPDPRSSRPAPSEGFCEVRGDNSEHSVDSRVFGPIPIAYIMARALFVRPARAAIAALDPGSTR
jgi:hypothetical protein